MKKTFILFAIIYPFIFCNLLAIEILDQDFVNWTDSYIAGEGSSAYMTWHSTGGLPGAHIESTTYTVGPYPDGEATHFLIKDDFIWNPSVQGGIDSLTFEIDVQSISGWGQGQEIRLLVYQDGKYFLAPYDPIITGCETSWHKMVFDPYTAEDFFLKDQVMGGNISIHPDFSINGSDLQFGFATRNGVSGLYTQKYILSAQNKSSPRAFNYISFKLWHHFVKK